MENLRKRWTLTGIVQGVGFRPHVARIASRYANLSGFCGNDALEVFIEAQGSEPDLAEFIAAVVAKAPPLAAVLSVKSQDIPIVADEHGFRIVASGGGKGARTLIPPDVALCADCAADMAQAGNRRAGYAFTTCTNCGPRMSIIVDLPYDRPNTTMVDFPMCGACRAEYTDPTNRRFHAQPISCYECGPHLWTVEADEVPPGANDPFGETHLPAQLLDGTRGGRSAAAQDRTLEQVTRWILDGKIVAVKGLGGFHLMVDATNQDAVLHLRARKQRDGKPFALMVGNLGEAQRLVCLDEAATNLLESPAHPIVLAPRIGEGVCEAVAPDLQTLGVMLAYTPLHSLLLARINRPVVATSANLSNEPLVFDNAEALARLSEIADAFLLHDRRIAVPVEDSVIMSAQLPGEKPFVLPVRRSRGYVPVPLLLRGGSKRACVLGVGGELKNTFTLLRDDMAFVSAHIGDMGTLAAQTAYDTAINQIMGVHGRIPGVVVRDKHPNYATTAWAQRYAERLWEQGQEINLVDLQHHRAHSLSLLAESGCEKAVIAVTDGTGYGDDGHIWGSEIFALDVSQITQAQSFSQAEASIERVTHLPYFPLPGGDLAVRQPWRTAAGLLASLDIDAEGLPLETLMQSETGAVVKTQIQTGKSPITCALGRYFDAAAAILDVCCVAAYEAHAPVSLQTLAEQWMRETNESLRPETAEVRSPSEIVGRLVSGMRRGTSRGALAYGFHRDLAHWLAAASAREARSRGCNVVGISGGSALNALLVTLCEREIREQGLEWLTHRIVPANDGGLSLGQAFFAYLVAK